jgi:hypothetical protein
MEIIFPYFSKRNGIEKLKFLRRKIFICHLLIIDFRKDGIIPYFMYNLNFNKYWSLLLKKVKRNTYMYTKTYEIGGSLNSKN